MARKCFVHLGAHKTGTSTFQHTLSQNRERLSDLGIHVPIAGWVDASPGHHNIAFAVAGQNWFGSAKGVLDDLVAELQYVDGDVLVSSEVFSCLQPADLNSLHSLLEAAGFEAEYLIFLRDQAQVIPSLYWEAVKHGETVSFDEFFRRAVREMRVRIRTLSIPLDYFRMLEPLAEQRRQVRIGAYHLYAHGNKLIGQLFDWVRPGLLSSICIAPSINHRAGAYTTEAYRLLNEQNFPWGTREPVREKLLELAREADREGAFSGLTPEQTAETDARFAEGNQRLRGRWGVDLSAAARGIPTASRKSIQLDETVRSVVASMLLNATRDVAARSAT